jgi:tetratricopeptide (TPR) repeat protein
MVSCKQCSTHNSLDSAFCKKCGTIVSEVQVQEARAKLEVLVAEGNAAFNEGRTGEAMAICESVLESDPQSTSALWLKAICHERQGEIALALECAELIVELNPDSDLDRIRRNHLRNKLSASLAYEKPDKRVAIIGGLAAAVLMVCIGILGVYVLRGKPQPDYVVSNDKGASLNDLLDKPTTQESPVQQQNTNQASTGTPVNSGGTSQPGIGDVPALGQRNTPSNSLRGNEPRLPDTGNTTQLPEPQGGIGPIRVDPKVLPQQEPQKPPTKPQPDDPTAVFPPGGNESTPPQTDPGQIEIDVYNNGSRSNATAKPAVSRNGAEAQRRTAYEAFQLGNYSQAANLFEQAIRSGGDPVTLNQRLGQTYERLGQSGNAIDAYRRAVQAGEAALAQNKANPSGIRSAVESSKQALKNLGG